MKIEVDITAGRKGKTRGGMRRSSGEAHGDKLACHSLPKVSVPETLKLYSTVMVVYDGSRHNIYGIEQESTISVEQESIN